MPNHFHGILFINETKQSGVGAQRAAPLRKNAQTRPSVAAGSLGAVVRAFKSAATRRINLLRDSVGAPVWQRNYHDHIIRDDEDLNRIREYILDNPRRWAEDQENPANWV